MSIELLSRLHFDQSFNGTFSSLSVSAKTFRFSTNMDEDSELAEKAFKISLNSLKVRLRSLQHSLKNLLKASKLTKIYSNDLFQEINLNTSILKSTFYPSGNINILPKATSDYLLTNNFAFNSTIYKITKKHITIQESTHSFSNSILCLNKISTSTALEDIEEPFIYRDIPMKNLREKRESQWLADGISDFFTSQQLIQG